MQIIHGTEGHMTVYGPVCHPQKVVVYGLLFGPYNIYGLTDRSINCHVAQSDINYLLYYTQPTKTTSIRTQLDALYGPS